MKSGCDAATPRLTMVLGFVAGLCPSRIAPRTLPNRYYTSVPQWLLSAARISALVAANVLVSVAAIAAPCTGKGVELQVLGSGGPELEDKRASSSYLLWQDGRARILVDSGGGSASVSRVRMSRSSTQFCLLTCMSITAGTLPRSLGRPISSSATVSYRSTGRLGTPIFRRRAIL
jgi:hypothetical protein